MKKLIFTLISLSLLTGCTRSVEVSNPEDTIVIEEEVGSLEYTREEDMYVKDEIKLVISDINDLREKYKDEVDDIDLDTVYIVAYGGDIETIQNFVIDKNDLPNKNYFDDLVDILDNSISVGLKDHLDDMEDEYLEPDELDIKKIGRTVVFTENRGEYEDNHIYIVVNFLDIKDEYYDDIFHSISADKYILDNVIYGKDLNLVSFVNPNNSFFMYNSDNFLKIRYNMFFEEKEMVKVNILLQGENGLDLEYDDLGVFINLLNKMDLSGDEKDLLIEEYNNVFKEQGKRKNIDLDKYKAFVDYSKGSNSEEINNRLVFFSIEKK